MFKIISTGQSLLLSALGPLFYAKKFVLVGDPEQLPPPLKVFLLHVTNWKLQFV